MSLPEARFADYIADRLPPDPAHDLQHVRRVVESARRFAAAEDADLAVVIPAAWLHDCVSLPKNHPERHLGSRLAAEEASRFLRSIDYPEALLPDIAQAIEAHSFSAGIPARTLEPSLNVAQTLSRAPTSIRDRFFRFPGDSTPDPTEGMKRERSLMGRVGGRVSWARRGGLTGMQAWDGSGWRGKAAGRAAPAGP